MRKTQNLTFRDLEAVIFRDRQLPRSIAQRKRLIALCIIGLGRQLKYRDDAPIIRLRYGLVTRGGIGFSRRFIAENLGMTAERVRAIEARALVRLHQVARRILETQEPH